MVVQKLGREQRNKRNIKPIENRFLGLGLTLKKRRNLRENSEVDI